MVEDLVREITSLWQTDELRREKPTPVDGEQRGAGAYGAAARAVLIVLLWPLKMLLGVAVPGALAFVAGGSLTSASCCCHRGPWGAAHRGAVAVDSGTHLPAPHQRCAQEGHRWARGAAQHSSHIGSLRMHAPQHAARCL